MSEAFSDHFSSIAATYAGFRPRYPAALFAWLAAQAPADGLAWDCATGNGQAAGDLAAHFKRVIATDASPAQIAAALPSPRVQYRVAPAEASGVPAAAVDLITVAQALHWFDLERFYAEAHRVLKPGGVLAVWSYGMLVTDLAAVNAGVDFFYRHIIGPYWPPERVHVERGYRDLPFPFREMSAPVFTMESAWTLPELLGYLRSWSATCRYSAAQGRDPVDTLADELAPLWGPSQRRRRVQWPLSMRVGKR